MNASDCRERDTLRIFGCGHRVRCLFSPPLGRLSIVSARAVDGDVGRGCKKGCVVTARSSLHLRINQILSIT